MDYKDGQQLEWFDVDMPPHLPRNPGAMWNLWKSMGQQNGARRPIHRLVWNGMTLREVFNSFGMLPLLDNAHCDWFPPPKRQLQR
jgi:hypothetical protein